MSRNRLAIDLLYFKASIKLIRDIYMKLMCKGQYQDALVIHLMYSLSLNPYHLYSLKYDDILSDNQIQYWDYKSSTYKTCYLYYELWSDINVIKQYQEAKYGILRKIVRIMIDKTKIRGVFIIDVSPTNIYNRFHRKFGKSIDDFDITPNDILQLSRFNAQKMTQGLYNRSLFDHKINLISKPN